MNMLALRLAILLLFFESTTHAQNFNWKHVNAYTVGQKVLASASSELICIACLGGGDNSSYYSQGMLLCSTDQGATWYFGSSGFNFGNVGSLVVNGTEIYVSYSELYQD